MWRNVIKRRGMEETERIQKVNKCGSALHTSTAVDILHALFQEILTEIWERIVKSKSEIQRSKFSSCFCKFCFPPQPVLPLQYCVTQGYGIFFFFPSWVTCRHSQKFLQNWNKKINSIWNKASWNAGIRFFHNTHFPQTIWSAFVCLELWYTSI